MAKPASAPRLLEQTRECPPLSLRAAVGTVNAEKRTAEVVWTTGAKVLRGFWDQWYEELSLDPKHVRMGRLNNGAPLLDTHRGMQGAGVASVLGVVESARIEDGKRGVATVRFARAEDDPEADKVFRKVKDGILRNISVGYRTYKLEKVEEAGKIPTMRAVDWEPYEISVVPAGEDDGAGFRSAEDRAPNACVIVTREEQSMATESTETKPTAEKPADQAGTTSVIEATRAAADKREREAEAKLAAEKRGAEVAVREEREREVAIRDIVRRGHLPDEFADKMIREGAKVEDVRTAVFDQLTTRSDATAQSSHLFEAGDDQRDKFVRAGCASIFQRAGTAKMIAEAKKLDHFADQFRDVVLDPGEFRQMTLLDLARASLERRGQSTRGLHGEALVKRALSFRDAGMNTAGDFAILLETAVNKTFLGQYALTPVTWRRWCGVKSVQDFRTSTFYRPGTFSVLDAVTEAGEIKHKNIPDGEKATLTPSTKGNIVGITRRAIVNDDLGVFRDLGGGLGMAAARTIETSAFALVLANSGLGPTMADSQPLFHTNRSNIGATGAMSVTTWDSASSVMAAQKDVSNNVILDLSTAVWLGPRTLQASALQLNRNTSDPTVNKSSGVSNPVQGMVRDVIATGRLTGTRHYFLADPAQYPVFAVGFIDGQEAPRIDSQESFEYDGVQWRIIMDYGVAVLDYRGSVTCAGA